MSLSLNERTNLIKLTVAMFNVAPGATYLAEITGLYEANGRSLANVATILSNTPAYKTLNPVFQTAAEFATALLTPMGLQANREANEFVIAKFNAFGTGTVNKGQISLDTAAALVNYTGADASLLAAKATLDNKTTVATYYSVDKQIAGSDLAVLKAVLVGVTADVATVATAKAAVDGTATAGQTFTLTTGVDTLTGTVGNDTFVGVADAGGTTLSVADSVNGGTGTDTLKFINNVAASLSSLQTTSVEVYQIQNLAASSLAINSQTTGLTNVNLVGGSNVAFGLTNVDKAVVVGMTSEAGQVTAAYTLATGTSDAVALNVNDAKVTSSFTANSIETITIGSTGAKSTLASVNGDTLSTLKVTGSQDLAITAALANTVTTVDASASTGGLTVKVGASVPTLKVTGGAGADVIDLNTTVINTTGATAGAIDGGAGSDTLVLNGSNQLTALLGVKYTNFETLQLKGGTTYDAGQIAGITKLVASADNLVVSNFAKDVSVLVNSNIATALTVSVKDATLPGTANTLNVTIDNATDLTNTTVAGVTIAGVETLSITSSGAATTVGAANALSSLAGNASLKTVNVSGTSGFNLVTGAAALDAINGATLDGIFSVDARANTTAVGITGGAKADVLVGGAGTDVINGGAGNDTIVGDTGAVVAGSLGAPETFEVKFTANSFNDGTSVAGGTVAFNGTTIAIAASETAAQTATKFVGGTFTNWIATIKGGTSDTVVFTSKVVGDVTPSAFTATPTDIDAINGNSGSFTTAPVTNNVNGTPVVVATTYSAATAAAADILTGGEGNDTFLFLNNGTSLTAVDTITDLNLGTAALAGRVDVLSFQGTVVASLATLTGAQQTAVTAQTSFADAVNAVIGTGGVAAAAGSVAQFTYGTETYIVYNGNVGAAFDNVDQIIKVTGVQGTLDISDVVVFA